MPIVHQRPFPLFLAIILVIEIGVLATLVIAFGTQPPFKYELGWAAIASFLAMQAYSLRRRVPWLKKLGMLDAWLDAHIFLGLQGTVFVAYHCVGLSVEIDLAAATAGIVAVLGLTGVLGRYPLRFTRVRRQAIWSLLHRPLAFLLVAFAALHVLAHFAYAV